MGVIWITGLSGAGKTSIAREVVRKLRDRGTACLLLDGDALREVLGGIGYDRPARLAAAYRIARLAQWVAAQDFVAVVATISLFHEIHAFNRSAANHYFEVWVRCADALLRERSPLHAKADGSDVVGRGQPAEFPQRPDLILDNNGDRGTLGDHAQRILAAWHAHVRV
jgi:adenylylsulfate kinase